MKFRRKSTTIEAEQYRVGACFLPKGVTRIDGRPVVHTIHTGQWVVIEDGDWIIPEPDGVHYYPCKPDIFAATYEPDDTPPTPPAPSTPICVGRPIIEILAREGIWCSALSDSALIAADCLFRKNPYSALENCLAWTRRAIDLEVSGTMREMAMKHVLEAEAILYPHHDG